MTTANVRQQVAVAYAACENKKGEDLVVLELEKGSSAFTDYFVLCTGSNPRQIQAISDEVEQQLAKAGARANQVEGYNQAEWVLLDYVDYVVHIFSATARKFYDLERLWKSAKRLTLTELQKKPSRKPAKAAKAAKKSAPRKTATTRPRTATAKRPARKATRRKG